MALTGSEILDVRGVGSTGLPSGETFQTTTQAIANLGGGGSAWTGQTITLSSSVSIDPTVFTTQFSLLTPAAIAVSVDPTTLTPWTPYTVKDAAGNASLYNITITPTSGTFEGTSPYVIFQNYGSVSFYSDETNIWVYQ